VATIALQFTERVSAPVLMLYTSSRPSGRIALDGVPTTVDGGLTWSATFTISASNPRDSGGIGFRFTFTDLAGNSPGPVDDSYPGYQGEAPLNQPNVSVLNL